MPAKPKGDKGPQETFKAGDITVNIDMTAAAKAGEKLRKMFDRMRENIMQIFLEWLQSEEGRKAIRKVIKEELKK